MDNAQYEQLRQEKSASSQPEQLKKAINFKNKANYKKWLAYGHMHDVFHGKTPVKIGGKTHKVKHTKK